MSEELITETIINSSLVLDENDNGYGYFYSGESWEDAYPDAALFVFAMKILCSTISLFGCVGNVFTMVVISTWDRISSGAGFMWALALTDLLSVFYDGILDTLLSLFDISVASLGGDVMCASFKFFSWITTTCSYYMTVLFSLDKCIAVMFPFKYRVYGKVNLCVASTVVVYLFSAIYSIPAAVWYRVDPRNQFYFKLPPPSKIKNQIISTVKSKVRINN
ncbi:cysteinyl leukotriene receptor 1-like [Symsagittifera roscoffensis]|uniref:cysteinyl leukotriene receptor 1-like n=1 Tax=Symsagittifera roscoffensis TaxID=84072 RepID=UPI00307C63C6